MAEIPAGLRSVISRLAEKVGLGLSDVKRLEDLKARLIGARAANHDREEEIKEEIHGLETRALKKKEEFEKTKGSARKVIAEEIERTFEEIDRVLERHRIISRNIRQVSAVLSKIGEIRAARERGASEDEVDTVAIEAQEEFETLETQSRATRDMMKEKFKEEEREAIDIDQRLGEMEGTDKEKSAPGLSKQTQDRLKQLETEYE